MTVRAIMAAMVIVTAGTDPRVTAAPPPTFSVAVVVHADVPVEALRLVELRQLLLGERQFWPDGTRVVLLLPPAGSDARTVVLERVYGMSETEYRRHWIAKLFRNEVVAAPKVVDDPAVLTRLVRTIPGALGVTAAPVSEPGLRVLAIDGTLPDDGAYPLRAGS